MNNYKFFSTLERLLSEGKMNYVIGVLRNNCTSGMASHPDMSRLIPKINRIADVYDNMRKFLVEGLPDPDRASLYARMQKELREIAREYLFILRENSSDPLFADYRMQKVRNRALAELIDEHSKWDYRITMGEISDVDTIRFRRKKEEAAAAIFFKVWSLPPSAEADLQAARGLLMSPDASFAVKSQVVTALLLGLLKFYVPAKFNLLLDAYDAETDERLAARLLTAIVIVAALYRRALLFDPDTVSRLEALGDSILTYTRLRDVVMTLVRTRDTDRVSREVDDAFQSTINELSPEMLERLRNQGMAPGAHDAEFNPEWENLMKNKKLEERMQAINDMQIEGMDVMMQTFARLKSFPFFRSLPNWFIPFTTDHSEVAPLFENFDGEMFLTMADATDMCASDRFSFALGILQMPEERRMRLSTHIAAQTEEMKEMLKERSADRRVKPVFASEALVFARDLYRFAKLYPQRDRFYDPFAEPVDFLALPVIGALLDEDGFKEQVADFYFNHGYYPQALPLYNSLDSSADNQRETFEKIGFSLQMLGDMAGALEAYEKADLFSTDADRSSLWLLKRMAYCNKALARYDAAARLYSEILERNKEDLQSAYNLGALLLRAGRFEEAKEHLARVNYLAPEKENYARTYSRLQGHLALLDGRVPDALRLYKEAGAGRQTDELRAEIRAELSSHASSFDSLTLSLLLDSL